MAIAATTPVIEVLGDLRPRAGNGCQFRVSTLTRIDALRSFDDRVRIQINQQMPLSSRALQSEGWIGEMTSHYALRATS